MKHRSANFIYAYNFIYPKLREMSTQTISEELSRYALPF